ncbi:hypothetical protein KUV80_03860 [Fictibacillus nanhaiensis]|uniref:HEPN domain-containing protein n=1 Tax=Fictibacillus nanhaiensis TaxID=742169 RepID=UPI001C95A559|nr:HEPN domain-containing protein [Fictibacillus nanhaiensis]MBY6035769.1 hypothetical protein [Fictibacillus nanhaiensis]
MIEKPVKDRELFQLFSRVVEDGIVKVSEVLTKKYYPLRYSNWPEISSVKMANGLKSISLTSYGENRPIVYSVLFSKFGKEEADVDINSINGYKELEVYMYEQKRITEYLTPEQVDDWDPIPYKCKEITISLIERYLTLHEKEAFSLEKFEEIYKRIEILLYDKELFLDICIPILFTTFENDEYFLGDNAAIVKIGDLLNKSRMYSTNSYHTPIPSGILETTTHALILSGYSISNESYWRMKGTFGNSKSYPLEKINNFFNCLRIGSGFISGYAQLLACPVDWTTTYNADLMPIFGTTIRSYPPSVNPTLKYSNLPVVSEENLKKIGNMFNKLQQQESNKILLANKRMHQCYLREDEEDSILDATIAMEALFSDGEKGDITYKLALRMSALLKLNNNLDMSPSEVFKSVKYIYGFRSSVVHGSSKSSKKRVVELSEGKAIPTTELAIKFLELAIEVFLEKPEYLITGRIEEELILKEGLQ